MRYPFEEYSTVLWVPGASGIAAIAAPTLAELATGTDLTCYLTKDGFNPGGSTSTVGSGSLCSRVDGKGAGSVAYDMSLKLYRDNSADTAWDLANWSDEGFIVYRPGVLYGTAFAAADDLSVWKGQMLEPVQASSAANAQNMFTLGIAVSDAEQKAVAAA